MRAKLMELTNNFSFGKLMYKRSSMTSVSSSTDSSTKSIEACDEEYRRLAIRWILGNFNQKVKKDTLYLAISYINRLSSKAVYLTEENWEKIVITILLLANKINQIYPPKITTMISKCKGFITKDEIIGMEAYILNVFDFDISIDSTPYTHMFSVLGAKYKDKLDQCEKLLKMVAHHRQIYHSGDEILSYAVIYLIMPQHIRDLRLKQNSKIKLLAIKIYNIYNDTKIRERHLNQKENK